MSEKTPAMVLGKVIGQVVSFDTPYDDVWQFDKITLSDVGMNLIKGNPTDDPEYECIQISLENGTITVYKTEEDLNNGKEVEILTPDWSVFNK